MDVIVE